MSQQYNKLVTLNNIKVFNSFLTVQMYDWTLLSKFFFIFFNFILLYNTVLVLPYIDMNPPQVYMGSQTWTPSHLPPHNIPLGHPRAPAPSMMYPASDIDWWFDSDMIVYMFQCHSPKSSHPLPLPLPLSPKVRYTHLCLFCCLAYRVIIAIFLNSLLRPYKSSLQSNLAKQTTVCQLMI